MGNGVSAARSTAAAATAEVAASAVLTSDDAYLDVEEVITKVRACDKDGNGKIDRRELQGLLASICVQGVETAAEKEDVISQAAGGVTTAEDLKDEDGEPVKDIDAKDKDGTAYKETVEAKGGTLFKDEAGKVKVRKPWMKEDNPIGMLWGIFGAALLMVKAGKVKPVIEASGAEVLSADNKTYAGRTAEEVVAACLGGFDTIVLATVFAGNWRSCWVTGLVATLLRNIPRCKTFNMFAVKGGPACDCEIQFIVNFMELLGAKVIGKAVDKGKFLVWGWKVKRDGADDCDVYLKQYKTVEDASVASLKTGFLARKDKTHAPNLKRCAVVSAPERDIAGEPIAARLNQNVGDALAAAKEKAAKEGFSER